MGRFLFLDLPTELGSRIMKQMDARSLVNMSLTCKIIRKLIYELDELKLEIDIMKAELTPSMYPRSSADTRKFIQNYLTARFDLPVDARHCDSITAPPGIRLERLFRGLLTGLTRTTVHVWDILRPGIPKKIAMFSYPALHDVVIEPSYNLLAILCYDRNLGDTATINLLDLRSNGAPHPGVTSPVITHTLHDDDIFTEITGRRHLTIQGGLLALTYYRDEDLSSRRGIIWDWRKGKPVYDSINSPSNFHDLLLLPSPNSFLVAACNFVSLLNVPDPTVTYGAWIQLHQADFSGLSPTSRLIAEFHLPEFDVTTDYYLGTMDFYTNEPPLGIIGPADDGTKFPFVSDPSTFVHALYIWYSCRPKTNARRDGSARVYLVISNKVFANVLEKWARPNDSEFEVSFPLCSEWDEWGPRWTSIFDYRELGILSGTSSICGSRICSVENPQDNCMEIFVFDFNMNFACAQRNCAGPLVHSPGTVSYPLWTHAVEARLPFHTQHKYITIPSENDAPMMCLTVVMDEERIIFSTCPEDAVDLYPTSWKVVHLLHDQSMLPPMRISRLLPWEGNVMDLDDDEMDLDA